MHDGRTDSRAIEGTDGGLIIFAGHVAFPKGSDSLSEEAREEDEEEKEVKGVGAGVPTKPIARSPEEHPSGSRGLWR